MTRREARENAFKIIFEASNLWASVLDATGQEFYMNPDVHSAGAIYHP